MVYDVTSEESFRHINDWLTEVNRYASENTCKLIVGNKIDLPNKVISTEKVKVSNSFFGFPTRYSLNVFLLWYRNMLIN
jgi:Ras-related protein Rab-1A